MKITPHLRAAQRLFVLLCCCFVPVQASVVLTGTRVIYAGNLTEKTLQFHNPDAHPNAVQVWLDDGDEASTAQTGVSPFIALPQVFRVEAQRGQMVRLLLEDASALAQDRESVFYLNFSQLPLQTQQAQNQLQFVFTSRVKVFYRPAGLAGKAHQAAEQLQLRWQAEGLHVYNPTPYHVVVRQARLHVGEEDTPALLQAQMLAPYTSVVWPVTLKIKRSHQLHLLWVNDYGADVAIILPIV